ncbi:endocuticle structural glycoprotein ABD-4-like [Athalia rosae]|uniref:endocuticle structural glycoprotein ABD-4-like n=1 Tax=Athalia rosae TaxID=37344 RepID=UPI0020347B1F|nr:endocuticle structural glycoprotein ABD-4-like [Athalia rosae]
MSTRRNTQAAMNALILTVLALVAAATAAPVEPEVIPIVSQSFEGPNPDGSYKWAYETGNGIRAQEQGLIENAGTQDEASSVQGEYAYTDNEGNPFYVTYTSGKDGFIPKGDHFPQPPPIPPGILKALEWIAAHPEEDNL